MGCKLKVEKKQLCRSHFNNYVHLQLRKVVPTLFVGPELAFGALDFQGTGHVTIYSIMQSYIPSQLTVSREELQQFLT